MGVSFDEMLARFLFAKDIRLDLSIKPDPFVPPPNLQLSVTRHLELSEQEIWNLAQMVAFKRNKPLKGRADFLTSIILPFGLSVVEDPIEKENPNHANIVDWPVDKPAQKSIAQEIAAMVGKAILFAG
jgi:hypothetical protein